MANALRGMKRNHGAYRASRATRRRRRAYTRVCCCCGAATIHIAAAMEVVTAVTCRDGIALAGNARQTREVSASRARARGAGKSASHKQRGRGQVGNNLWQQRSNIIITSAMALNSNGNRCQCAVRAARRGRRPLATKLCTAAPLHAAYCVRTPAWRVLICGHCAAALLLRHLRRPCAVTSAAAALVTHYTHYRKRTARSRKRAALETSLRYASHLAARTLNSALACALCARDTQNPLRGSLAIRKS